MNYRDKLIYMIAKKKEIIKLRKDKPKISVNMVYIKQSKGNWFPLYVWNSNFMITYIPIKRTILSHYNKILSYLVQGTTLIIKTIKLMEIVNYVNINHKKSKIISECQQIDFSKSNINIEGSKVILL